MEFWRRREWETRMKMEPGVFNVASVIKHGKAGDVGVKDPWASSVIIGVAKPEAASIGFRQGWESKDGVRLWSRLWLDRYEKLSRVGSTYDEDLTTVIPDCILEILNSPTVAGKSKEGGT